MRYLFFALLVAVAVWYFFIRGGASSTTATATLAPVSPEQQFQSVLSGSTVDAGRLASLCASYPQLGAQLLTGRQIRIQGTIAEVRTSGMENRRADVLLSGGGPRKIVLVCDLDQYSGPGVNFRYLGRFEAVGTELLYLIHRDRTTTKKVVTTQGAEISQFSSLKSMGASLIEFQMVNGPAWAGAETNR